MLWTHNDSGAAPRLLAFVPRGALRANLRVTAAENRDLGGEGQGEALALSPDGRAFYTVPKGRRPAVRHYAAGG